MVGRVTHELGLCDDRVTGAGGPCGGLRVGVAGDCDGLGHLGGREPPGVEGGAVERDVGEAGDEVAADGEGRARGNEVDWAGTG